MVRSGWRYRRWGVGGLLLAVGLSCAGPGRAQAPAGARARFGTPVLVPGTGECARFGGLVAVAESPPRLQPVGYEAAPGTGARPGDRPVLLPPESALQPDPAEAASAQKPGCPPCSPGAAQDGQKKEGEPKDGDKKDGDKKDDDTAKPFWQTHPRYPVLPRPGGFFQIPPTGPGYYSLKDLLTHQYRENPPPFGYNRFALYFFPFFDADFRYVEDPKKNKDIDCLEKLHRVHLGCGDDWLFGTGGEFTYRLSNEINSRGTGKDNRYDLTRVRLFGDLWYRDLFRIYIEGISAQSFNQDLKPLPIDRDYLDLLNLFIDLKIFQEDGGVPWYLRGGRQQLAFGSQRLISPLVWVNTMRTFEGVRGFRHGEKFDADLFWVQPVIPNATRFDSVDRGQNFAGAWTTYRPNKDTTWDLYYLFLDNNNKYKITPTSAFPGPITSTPFSSGSLAIDGPYNVHTLGTRFTGDYHNFLYDFEPMLQLGRRQHSDIIAGASASGVGWHFKEAPWNPVVWAYYDWASGSNNPLAGQLSTFNQLFPFGHYYLGWMDFVGRQNIQDYNLHLWLYPTKWITTQLQYHLFRLANPHDALYGGGGAPLRFDPTGNSGRDVGQEIDFITNFHLTRHQDILLAYGHLFFGDFLRNTGPGNAAQTCWLLYNVRW